MPVQVYIDQLKEYMYYAAALQALCHKYTVRQYQLERLDDSLSQLSQRRENALQGRCGWSGLDLADQVRLQIDDR